VLFLDEFPLFRADVIEALRQPLESGDVTIARQEESVTLPARGMVVLACNPCPCGDYSADVRMNSCRCREVQRRDYRAKITGPVADRVDIVRHLQALQPHDGRDPSSAAPESSDEIRRRVVLARERQQHRYREESWRLNGHAPGPVLRERWPVTADAQRAVDDQMYHGRLSRRGATRVHRLAWTIADLRGVDRPGRDEVDVALRLRTGDSLMLSTLEPTG
jgi:magnesium chelatase family protein